MMRTVLQVYNEELVKRGFTSDPAQLDAIKVLDTCREGWVNYKQQRSNVLKKLINHPAPPRGVYMYGGVGRGKSFLMDCFFLSLPLKRKVRLHFHEFMRDVHHELQRLQGHENPLDELGKQIAKKYKLICFDEFHVSDITDAMVLYRLLESLFKHGVGMVTTSNYSPDGLYPDGLNRSRFLPAIELIKDFLTVINVDNGVDYRTDFLSEGGCYFCPNDARANAAMLQAFQSLKSGKGGNDSRLVIESRTIKALKRSGGLVWFDFETLCMGNRSQQDYLALADQFHTVMLSDVPKMLSNMVSAARRFTWLVDVLYDRKVKLIISAEVPANGLYEEGVLANEFERTVSRINEMQSREYLEQSKREHVSFSLSE